MTLAASLPAALAGVPPVPGGARRSAGGAALRRLLRRNCFAGLGTALYETFGAPTLRPHHQAVAARLAAALPAAAAVLDVGCGPGDLLLALARLRGDLDLVGIDRAGAAIARLRARARRAGLRVRALRCPVEAMPFASGRFAAAVCIGTCKHWRRPVPALAAIARVLDAGAPLLLSELDPAGAARFQALGPGWRRMGAAGAMARLAAASMPRATASGALRAAGFAVLAEGVVDGLPLWEITALRAQAG